MSGFSCNECFAHFEEPLAVDVVVLDRTLKMGLCPECKAINDTVAVCCDVPGCKDDASCGWPAPNGQGFYRTTCYRHMAEAT